MGCSALAGVRPMVAKKTTSINGQPFGTEKEAREFVKQALLPVDGFAASRPASPRRQADLRISMAKISRTDWSPRVGGGEIRAQLPPEVVCHVKFDSVAFHGCVLALFEHNDMSKSKPAKVEATIQGVLGFPPEVYVKKARRFVSTRKVAAAGLRNAVRPWRLEVEVRAMLEQAAEINALEENSLRLAKSSSETNAVTEASDSYLPLLKVSCQNMQHDDAVGDSWFAYADILPDLQEMLNIKLQNTLEDFNDHIWQGGAKTFSCSNAAHR